MHKVRQETMVIIVLVISTALVGVSMLDARSSFAQDQTTTQRNEAIYRIQKTAMSTVAPVAHTGNLPHAVVFALPIRNDSKIYTGHVTFTASKPIEIEILHLYKPDQVPDQAHGSPPTATINGTTITYSHLTGIVDNNIITGDIPTASGTFEFTGSGLVFHKRSSEPFTVTYTLDVVLRSLTQ